MRRDATSRSHRARAGRTLRAGRATLAAACLAATSLAGCGLLETTGLKDRDPLLVTKDDAPDVAYEKARELFRAERWEDAENGFDRVWEDHPESPLAADARFYAAEARYGRGKYNGAFALYKRFLAVHPLSPHAPLIQRRLYDMGRFLVEEGQTGLLFSYSDEGIEMLDYLVSAFPNGDLADDALLYAADHEARTHKPERAIAHLHDLIDNYGGSEWVLEARLDLARAYRDVNRGSRYDGDTLAKSKAYYLSYIEIVSADAAREREYAEQLAAARTELAEVDEILARKMLETADFYLRTGRPEAARAELRNLLRDHPGTPSAAEAADRLGRTAEEDAGAVAPEGSQS